MYLGSLRLNLLQVTKFQRMFKTGVLNLEPDELYFPNVPGITEAEPFAGHHVPEDVHNRNVENI
jgi:hypothetical protein